MRRSSSTRRAGDVGAAEQGVGDRVRLVVDLLVHEGREAALLGGRGVPVDGVAAGLAPASPAKSVTVTSSGVSVTTWSWPSSSASRVCAMNAATSEPRKFSPSPRPTTSGESCRAPTTMSGASACTASSVKVPSRRPRDGPHRLGQVAGRRRRPAASRCAATSVSVSERNSTPSASSSALSTREVLDDAVVDHGEPAAARGAGGRWRRSGAPWVAQRVCPIAAVAPGSGCASSSPTRLASLPAFFAVASPPPSGGHQRDPGRVVAAVLQPAQALQDDVERPVAGLLGPDVPDDSAHGPRVYRRAVSDGPAAPRRAPRHPSGRMVRPVPHPSRADPVARAALPGGPSGQPSAAPLAPATPYVELDREAWTPRCPAPRRCR